MDQFRLMEPCHPGIYTNCRLALIGQFGLQIRVQHQKIAIL